MLLFQLILNFIDLYTVILYPFLLLILKPLLLLIQLFCQVLTRFLYLFSEIFDFDVILLQILPLLNFKLSQLSLQHLRFFIRRLSQVNLHWHRHLPTNRCIFLIRLHLKFSIYFVLYFLLLPKLLLIFHQLIYGWFIRFNSSLLLRVQGVQSVTLSSKLLGTLFKSFNGRAGGEEGLTFLTGLKLELFGLFLFKFLDQASVLSP